MENTLLNIKHERSKNLSLNIPNSIKNNIISIITNNLPNKIKQNVFINLYNENFNKIDIMFKLYSKSDNINFNNNMLIIEQFILIDNIFDNYFISPENIINFFKNISAIFYVDGIVTKEYLKFNEKLSVENLIGLVKIDEILYFFFNEEEFEKKLNLNINIFQNLCNNNNSVIMNINNIFLLVKINDINIIKKLFVFDNKNYFDQILYEKNIILENNILTLEKNLKEKENNLNNIINKLKNEQNNNELNKKYKQESLELKSKLENLKKNNQDLTNQNKILHIEKNNLINLIEKNKIIYNNINNNLNNNKKFKNLIIDKNLIDIEINCNLKDFFSNIDENDDEINEEDNFFDGFKFETIKSKDDNNNINNKTTEDEDKGLCLICLENKSSYAFRKCGHMCVCKNCKEEKYDKLKTKDIKCPLCMTKHKKNEIIEIFTC